MAAIQALEVSKCRPSCKRQMSDQSAGEEAPCGCRTLCGYSHPQRRTKTQQHSRAPQEHGWPPPTLQQQLVGVPTMRVPVAVQLESTSETDVQHSGLARGRIRPDTAGTVHCRIHPDTAGTVHCTIVSPIQERQRHVSNLRQTTAVEPRYHTDTAHNRHTRDAAVQNHP